MSVRQVLVAVDQLANTLIGGWADESISARAYRMHTQSKRWKLAMEIIDRLFFWEQEHCQWAWMVEKARKQLPLEYRN